MKEALIAGAAVFLLSYLFVTILIKISRVIDRYKMKKKTDKIKVGQRYEYKGYFMDPFERGKHIIKILDIKEGIMEKKVTIKEGMDIFYKNAGKGIWVYIGLFGNKVLSILKNKGVIACENDAEYCVLMDGEDHFISIAKDMSHDYCCEYVVERAEAYRDYPSKGATCSVCLFEDNENKAREMLKEAIIELSKNNIIDCDGL